jgi:hypothetical protein
MRLNLYRYADFAAHKDAHRCYRHSHREAR